MAKHLEALNAKDFGWMEFTGNKQPKCPHCGEEFNIEDNEAWYLYEDGFCGDAQCPTCSRDFNVSVRATYTFDTDEQYDEEQS